MGGAVPFDLAFRCLDPMFPVPSLAFQLPLVVMARLLEIVQKVLEGIL